MPIHRDIATESSDSSDPAHLLNDELLARQARAMLIAGDLESNRMCRQVVGPLVAELEHASNVAEAVRDLREHPKHLVIVDLTTGHDRKAKLELRRYLASHHPDTSVVILSDRAHAQLAVEAVRAGAFDVVDKPIDPRALAECVRRAASHAIVEQRLHRIAAHAPQVSREGIVGESAPVLRMLDQIGRVADTDVTVLITGESGTGKELVARALHHNGRRSSGPFVPVNCAAIPSELLEAELFGHAKGAFTDAKHDKAGLFVRAQGGTLFLDEIGEMPADMQVKLLRALQERRVRPVGGDEEIPFDIRVVAATNRDLEREVADGEFREDLYYRLNVVRLETPPLRERGDDVLLLAEHFRKRWAERLQKPVVGFSGPALETLRRHPWPGNVRQLENILQRAVALAQSDVIVTEDFDLPDNTAQSVPQPAPSTASAPAARSPIAVDRAQVAPTPAPDPAIAPPPPTPSPAPPPMASPATAPAHEWVSAPLPARPEPASVISLGLDRHLEQWTRQCLGQPGGRDNLPSLERLEEIYVDVVVAACQGNKTKAAEVLGIARRTLYRRLQRREGANPPKTRDAANAAAAANLSDDVI